MKNKRKIIIISTMIFITVITIGYFSFSDSKNSLEKETGFDIAISVDNNVYEDIPTSKAYEVTASCKNATAKWDYDSWKLVVTSVKGDVSCNVEFTSKTLSKFSTTIEDLVSTTSSQTDWKVVSSDGIRYQGLNPNNYVWFNGELWRVIGVFDDTIHGVSDSSLVKIVRNTEIGSYAYGADNSNFVTLLNDSYLNSAYTNTNDACKLISNSSGGETTLKDYCDFTANGLKSNYVSMIEQTSWMVPTFDSTTTKSTAYSADVYSSSGTYNTGKIGLASISDYAYASLNSSCTSSTALATSNACSADNWLYYGLGEEFNASGYCAVNKSGMIEDHLVHNYAIKADIARPALYLSDSIYVLAGDGSSSNPYIISTN